MKSIIIILITLYIGFHVAAFLINRHDNAEVWLNNCFETPKIKCTIYKGALRQTFIKQDYIVTVEGKDIYIPKEQVTAIKWDSKND